MYPNDATMQTGVISFCDRVGFNIKSNETKEELLRVLERDFALKIIQRQWHRLDTESIHQVTRAPHWMCLRSNGNPYLMFFTTYEDVAQIFYIDKKIQPGYYHPRVIMGRGFFDAALFANTLLDGEMVKNKAGKWVFLINDLIALKGKHLTDIRLGRRLEMAYELFDTAYSPDSTCDVCSFKIKRYFPTTPDGMTALRLFADGLPYSSRGVYMWPFNLRYKPKLHNFDDTLVKAVHCKVKETAIFQHATSARQQPAPAPQRPPTPHRQQPTQVPMLPAETSSSSSSEADAGTAEHQDARVMWLRKSEHSDVYDVCTTQAGGRVGVAYIPSLAVSKIIRQRFKDATVATSYAFRCTYSVKFKKWMPEA